MSKSEHGGRWRFHLLGQVTATYDGKQVDLGGPVAKAVLAALLLAGRRRTTESLVTTVWGGPAATSRDSVYQYIRRLREALDGCGPGARIAGQRPGYHLVVDDEAVDWRRFRRLEREAAEARAVHDLDRAAVALRAALGLWSGPPLDGIGTRLAGPRADLLDHRRTALEHLAGIEAAKDRPETVVALLHDEVRAAPHRERMAVLLIEALDRLGRRDAAGAVYQRTAHHLRTHSGLDPGPRLEQAHRAVLTGSAAHAPVARPRPGPDRHFTGRDTELAATLAALRAGAVCVIQGMPGVGKTTLAVQAAEHHPGYHLLDMTRYADADAALGALLHRLGARIPAGPDERVELLSAVLRKRPALLVFDDVRDAAQVRPLLPDGPALITTRTRLASLDDATVITVGPMPAEPATRLFRSVAGEQRLTAEPGAGPLIAEIVAHCGGLPLALRITAARYRLAGSQTLADLRDLLADRSASLDELDDGERSVQVSFRTAVAALDDSERATLALLAAAPGPDIELLAASALLGAGPAETAVLLHRLTDRHLVSEHRRRRFRMHDLLRAHLRRSLTSTLDPEPLSRLTAYYLHAAEAADRLVTPHRFRRRPAVTPGEVTLPAMADYHDALGWLTDEQHNLAATCVTAAEQGLDQQAWRLAYALRGFYYIAKPWPEWLATHEAALRSAQRLGDPAAETTTLNNLGLAYLELGRFDDAADHYRRAEELADRSGDRHASQNARANLAWLHYSRAEYDRFLVEIQPVYESYVATGSERNAAITLRGIGLAEGELRRVDDAITHLGSALAMFERLGLPLDTAMTFNALGDAHRHAGQDDPATWAYQQGLSAAERCGSGFEQARAHHHLGEIAYRRGRTESALRHWRSAAAGYRELGARQEAEVRRAIAGAGAFRSPSDRVPAPRRSLEA
jgi:DNA-binding SARP family transcriptional activator/tetratricopeptide (TPR) repeat protein